MIMEKFRLKLFSGLPRSIYVLLVAHTISGFGYFVVPYLSLYLNNTSGMDKDIIGIFIAVSTLAFIPGVIIGGKLTDHYSRKKVLVTSRFISALCLLVVLFISDFYVKLILISLFTLFTAIATPSNDALIADLTPSHQRKQAYSLVYLGANFGGGIGSLVAGYAFKSYPDIIFIGEAVAILVFVFLILTKIKESKDKIAALNKEEIEESKRQENTTSNDGENSISVLLKRPILLIYIALSAAYTFSYAQNYFCLPLFIDSNFPLKSSYYFGILMLANSIVVICCTAWITKVTIKFSPVFNMFIVGLFYAFGFGMHYMINTFYLLVVGTVLWTVGEILYNTNYTVFIVEKSPYEYRGRMISIASLVTRGATIINPLIMGKIIQRGNSRTVWLIVFFIMAVASISMFYLSVLENRDRNLELEASIDYH